MKQYSWIFFVSFLGQFKHFGSIHVASWMGRKYEIFQKIIKTSLKGDEKLYVEIFKLLINDKFTTPQK